MSRLSTPFGDGTTHIGSVNGAFQAAMGEGRGDLDDRVDDRVITRMRVGRTVIGTIAALWLIVAYPLSSGRQDFVLGKLAELGLSCAVLMTGTVIGIAAFLIASTPYRRRAYTRRLGEPALAFLALAAGPTAVWLSVTSLKGELITGDDLLSFFASIFGRGIIAHILSLLFLVIGWLLSVALVIVSIPYTLVAAYVCVTTCFRASSVHPLLPALLSPLLVWSLFAFQLFSGPDIAAPPEVLYAFLLGGPLSVTALSVWEVRRLRTLHGITLRTAMGR
ncbi:hypothetical protein ABZZ17_07410 [Streptomyces sp. NPDC006512]|uniref:hypothetical protein n=1 Tax=Streptomyces sp. NPDC006512 TaxID=3154307 RepID=UPI0033A4308C